MQLINASLLDLVTRKTSDNLKGKLSNKLNIGLKIKPEVPNRAIAFVRLNLSCYSEDFSEQLLDVSLTYQGVFETGQDFNENDLEKMAYNQAVFQLLPYIRSAVSYVTSLMFKVPVEIPSFDVIESMKLNQERTGKTGD